MQLAERPRKDIRYAAADRVVRNHPAAEAFVTWAMSS
jgi:hypothetical protein